MNCQDIKNRLNEKDNEIKLRNEKTYEYFNLVKDEVVDLLIGKHIEGEFKSDYYNLSEGGVMEILYKKLGFNVELFFWDHSCESFWREYFDSNNFKLHHLDVWLYIDDEDENLIKSTIDDRKKNSDKHELVKKSFDYKMFGNLLVDYIKKKGFKQQIIVGKRSGRKFKEFAFRIQRSQLENNCCENGGSVSFVQNNNDEVSQGSVIAGILITLVVVVLAFLFLFYGVK